MNFNPVILADNAVDYTKPMEMADAIPFGLETVLLGMGVIFSVLIILWIVLSVFKVIFYKPADGEKKVEMTPAPAPVPEPVVEVPEEPSQTDNAELVAAITAAIATMLDAPQTSFRVVSFRRTARK